VEVAVADAGGGGAHEHFARGGFADLDVFDVELAGRGSAIVPSGTKCAVTVPSLRVPA
jgi:hypothetical protein